MNFTQTTTYRIKQTSTPWLMNDAPLLDLSSLMLKEMNGFYQSSLEKIKRLHEYLKSNFYEETDYEDQMYYNELYSECMDWYLEEGKELYLTFSHSLSPFFIRSDQMNHFFQSKSRLEERWKDLCDDIESLEESEDLFQWLLDLPYLLEKRLRAFGIISIYRNINHSTYGHMFKQQELKTTITMTSPKETGHFISLLKGCAS